MKPIVLACVFAVVSSTGISYSQSAGYWHGLERELRYTPEGEDFVIVNGNKKFTRALYGTNTAFRLETSDVPEFGFFMPNMGGNMQLGVIRGDKSLWLNKAQYIKSIYRPGARIYEIKDPFLGSGTIGIYVLAMADAEGMVMKIEASDIPPDTELFCMYGGASNKKFSRNGDLGADPPNAFALMPAACANNKFIIADNTFELQYGLDAKGDFRSIVGAFPLESSLKTASPYHLDAPLSVWASEPTDNKMLLLVRTKLSSQAPVYIAIKNNDKVNLPYSSLPQAFADAEARRKEIAGTVKIATPDPYFNTLGGVLSTAADGIWDGTCWQHGAVGWRMPLNGWRAAYAGDAVGRHDRARIHFDNYAASQVTAIEPVIPHPAQDEKLNLARALKKWGTPMYSNGYISRNPNDAGKMHHYDMNLCYIDELLWHFNWTGDMEYVEKMWPTLERHLAWEKRNFDPDGDGLYDAYASIWASDALQYSSGGVTHSSAYNYRANKMAAEIATKIGQDPKPYADEAAKILKAINAQLWINNLGNWAEYKDLLGNKTVHPNAALWTIYHAIDSDIHTPFQSYQATRYVDTEIPHIPVSAKRLKDEGYQTVSTTNWLPYSWSINNVAFAEVAHTCLAYWQAGRSEEAFKLFKSSILDGMYLGASPGNIGQISFYDAARGECYRDFGDPVGVYSRALIQGLFGILPDAMNNRLEIRPGFPSAWDSASISTPDIDFDFQRKGLKDTYTVNCHFQKALSLDLLVKAKMDKIKSLKVNGTAQNWSLAENVGLPLVKISVPASSGYIVEIEWAGNRIQSSQYARSVAEGDAWTLEASAPAKELYDPQGVLKNAQTEGKKISGTVVGELGHRTLFVRLEYGQMTWWEPVAIEVKERLSVDYDPESVQLSLTLKNNSSQSVNGQLSVNGWTKTLKLAAGGTSAVFDVPAEYTRFGTNELRVIENGQTIFTSSLINWNLRNPGPAYETVDIDAYLNAPVNTIFKNEYLSPRSPYTTLQIPKQGIGEWCHPEMTANIDDSGIRKASTGSEFKTSFGIPFRTTGSMEANNIIFTTLWDNYPDEISIPLSGKAAHAYLLMAGTTNHMQCHVTNGVVTVYYKDGSGSVLNLVNPETWAPIEQDFFLDDGAFKSGYPRPYRVALKTGLVSRNLDKDMKIHGVYGREIDGGAGIILDIPLDKTKELSNITVKTIANEVIIGLMSLTLLK